MESKSEIKIVKNLFGISIAYMYIFTATRDLIDGRSVIPSLIGFVVTSVVNYVVFSYNIW